MERVECAQIVVKYSPRGFRGFRWFHVHVYSLWCYGRSDLGLAVIQVETTRCALGIGVSVVGFSVGYIQIRLGDL